MHKHEHKPRVNRDDASTSARSFFLRLCLRRLGSHAAYAHARACVVRVSQPVAAENEANAFAPFFTASLGFNESCSVAESKVVEVVIRSILTPMRFGT